VNPRLPAGLEGSRLAARPGLRSVGGHVLRPELDHVAVGIGDVDRAVGAQLDRPLDLDALRAQPLAQPVEQIARELEREVDVRASAPAGQSDLRRPDTEPRAVPDQVPAAVVAPLAVACLLESERLPVEAPRRL
jgi:hypothetical protein